MEKEFRSFEDLFVNELGLEIESLKNKQYLCPFCSDSRTKQSSKNKRVFYADLETGNYQCNHCDEKGHIVKDFCKEKNINIFKEVLTTSTPKKQINKLMKPKSKQKAERKPFRTGELQASALKLLKERGISEATAKACKLAQFGEWLVFNYYVDLDITNAKYRKVSNKQFMQHANCENMMYGINDIDKKRVVIVEGEFDKLAAFEAGVKSCLSVSQGAPNAGSDIGAKLKCISNSADYLEDVEFFVIAVDADENGRYLEKHLIERFGAQRCAVVVMPKGCKDLNDVLLKLGATKLNELIDAAERPKVDGAIYLKDEVEDLDDEFLNGIEKALKCGVLELDDYFGFYKGWTYLFHGIPNSGKSVFTLFLMMLMSVKYGWKWAVFSPEHFPAKGFYRKAIKMLTGKDMQADAMTREEYEKAKEFIDEHFIVVYPEIDNESNTIYNVLDIVKRLKLRHDIDGYLVDPFNQLSKTDTDARMNIDGYIERALLHVGNVNKRHNLVGLIVAHPRTIRDKNDLGDYIAPDAYQIAGGAMWYNKADVIINVHRPFNKTDKSNKAVDIDVQKVKDYDIVGATELDVVNMTFDLKTGWYKQYKSEHSALRNEFNKIADLKPEISFHDKMAAANGRGANGRPLDDDGDELPF